MRQAELSRKTAETDITLKLNIDGKGESNIDTGCGFLNHMLTLFAKHARIDLDIKAVGDVDVDYHHTVEDVGIALGSALKTALGHPPGMVSNRASVVHCLKAVGLYCNISAFKIDHTGKHQAKQYSKHEYHAYY